MSNKVAIIGVGNKLRRDDGIGLVILESLRSFYKKENIDYLDFGIASFDLIHRIKDYRTVLLIDGIDTLSLKPGEFKIFGLKEVVYTLKNSPTSTHDLNLKNLFDICGKLKIKTKIYIAGIQVKDTSFGEGLTLSLEEKVGFFAENINLFFEKELIYKK